MKHLLNVKVIWADFRPLLVMRCSFIASYNAHLISLWEISTHVSFICLYASLCPLLTSSKWLKTWHKILQSYQNQNIWNILSQMHFFFTLIWLLPPFSSLHFFFWNYKCANHELSLLTCILPKCTTAFPEQISYILKLQWFKITVIFC